MRLLVEIFSILAFTFFFWGGGGGGGGGGCRGGGMKIISLVLLPMATKIFH